MSNARRKSKKVNTRQQAFNLRVCVEESLDLLANRAQEKGLELAYSYDPQLPNYFIGDTARIRQILVNHCLNAFQACNNQSPVRLCAQVWGGQVRVMVIDQGCGISEADLQRIRQPFFTSQARGTGLGLSISQQLLDANGARMDDKYPRSSARV